MDMDELFFNNFQATNLEGCRQIINQPEFDVTRIFTQDELSKKLQNFPIMSSTVTLNILQLIARLGKQWASPLITCILDRGVDIDGVSVRVDIDSPNGDGWTALMLATRYSNNDSSLETVEALIRAKAKLDLQTKDGWTALMLASRHSNTNSSLETVETLIRAKANLDLQTKNGSTALMLASSESNTDSSLETVETLIRAGANLDFQNKNGWTALMLASCHSNTGSSLETVEALIQANANLDLQNKEGSTALMMVSCNSNTESSLETVEALIRAGANLDLQGKDSWTALMWASRYSGTDSSLETVEALIRAKANLDLQNKNGWTALMLASCHSNTGSSLETVEALIQAKANLDLKNKYGQTALMIASSETVLIKTENLIKKALLSNEYFLTHAKLILESEQSFEKLLFQFEFEIEEIKTKTILCNTSRINKIQGSRVCNICREQQSNVFSCSHDGCGVVCKSCLIWYLEANPKLIPVSRQNVPGMYCLISQTHVFVLSHLIRSLIFMSDSTSTSTAPSEVEHLERLDLSLQERYISEYSNIIRTAAKQEALQTFLAKGQIATIVRQIESTILCDVCPNCQQPFVSDGCESVKCTCGFNFCNVCLVFKTRGDVHKHVRDCIQKNMLKCTDDYFLSLKDRTDWRNRQRCRKTREFLESSINVKTLDWIPILVSLHDRHVDLRPFLYSEFPEYQTSLK